MKPFPIKVVTDNRPKSLFIEWKLHDKCNYDCVFCTDENKAGVKGWFSLEKNKEIADAIHKMCDGKPYWIQFTGGEPTLYPQFKELLTHIKKNGGYIRVISNGSRTIRWWKEVKEANLMDMLFITFHSQQNASYKHVAEVLNLFHDTPTVTIGIITYIKKTVKYALEGAEYLMKNTGSWVSLNAMDLLDGYIDDTVVSEEDYEKIQYYTTRLADRHDTKMPTNIPEDIIGNGTLQTKITYSDGSVEVGDPTLLMKTKKNQFKGWKCEAGLDTMLIHSDMIYRGGCARGGKPFKSIEDIKFFDEAFVCDTDLCFCATDMITPKYRDINDPTNSDG